ncbi:CYTH domain-containing protein [Odoribacter sp. Z80]|uniref:CYTH domain-containing protein n=1 Tax=Odoribacter sp. Z80 TaxID=2304575 RepID=UPI00137A92D4|nr:CYTH domain-containing protein [Odoribacter sp. Z80]NCE71959.1 CYTH domain-containing protein [Odoribacter sp. Z80]
MAQEIERKFLVAGEFKSLAYQSVRIVQGYLCSVPERTVRVRVRGDQGFITIKGKSDSEGLSRYEWEKQIAVEEARELLQLCEPGVIDKVRYFVRVGKHVFEVDEFYGENEGLVVAEVELKNRDEAFERPEWLGPEVTGDLRYYNGMLSKCPYKRWLAEG